MGVFSGRSLRCGVASVAALATSALAANPTPVNPRFTGSPFMQIWANDEFDASPVARAVIQDPRSGFIYVGNNAGVLEFDGVRWRSISVAGSGAVHALVIDGRGRLWYLTANSFGRLEPDAQGTVLGVHAMNRLPAGERALGVTLGARPVPEGVFFFARQRLIFVPNDDAAPARTWTVPSPLVSLWTMDGAPHVGLANGTWWRVRDDALEPAATATGPVVFAARTTDAGGTMLLTPQGPVRPGGAPADPASGLGKNELASCALFLADGRSAFGTDNKGLLLFDAAGRYLQRIDRELGLPANRVHGLCEDREGGVWLALHRGMARLQLASAYATHGLAQRISGTPHGVARIDGQLYVVHSEGLMVADERGQLRTTASVPGGLPALLKPGYELFASAALPHLRLSGDPMEIVDRTPWDRLVPLSGAPGTMALGTKDGLFLARVQGDSWQLQRRIGSVGRNAKPQLESPAGMLWVASPSRVWRMDFRQGVRANAPFRTFGAAEGLPAGRADFGLLGGQVVALVGGRLLRFDAASDRFVPETRIAGLTSVAGIGNDNAGMLWFAEAGGTGRFIRTVQDGPDRWRTEIVEGGHLAQRRVIAYHDSAVRTEWFTGQGGLVSMDLDWRPTHTVHPLTAVVRRVVTPSGDRVALPTLTPEQTALRFEFAAPSYHPDFSGKTSLRFRSRLEGLDVDWTPWSSEPFREISNLPYRDLRLRVQARDALGRESGETSLAFTIVPPWWRTGWALTGFGALGLLAVAGVVQRRTHALRRRAVALEALVAERTLTLHAQNDELTRLHLLELDENASLRHAEEKARLEVLRYQLNPHFLYNSLNSIYGLLFENARGAGEMVLRLSEFCRATLTVREGEQPTLGGEFEVLRIYLEVEKVRWGDGLQIEISVAPDVAAVRLPPFLLLPLVENAVKYGGRTSPGTLRLRLTARREGPAVLIEIANSGTWFAPDPKRTDSTGLGIENLRERLRRHFPDAHDFTLGPTEGWVVAKLRLTPSAE